MKSGDADEDTSMWPRIRVLHAISAIVPPVPPQVTQGILDNLSAAAALTSTLGGGPPETGIASGVGRRRDGAAGLSTSCQPSSSLRCTW